MGAGGAGAGTVARTSTRPIETRTTVWDGGAESGDDSPAAGTADPRGMPAGLTRERILAVWGIRFLSAGGLDAFSETAMGGVDGASSM